MPDGSLLPFITACGQTMMVGGVLVLGAAPWVSGIGLLLTLGGIYAWCSEPVSE